MWMIIDKNGRFRSKMRFARLGDAMKYRRILQARYPQFELTIVMEKGETK